jgi:Uma2 family endonuclease
MSSLPIHLVTFEEFDRLPDPSGGYYELQRGQIVYMPFRTLPHAVIQDTLADLLKPFARGRWRVMVQFPFRATEEYEYRQADIAFIANEKWQSGTDYFFGAPDLVIEVRSPSNTRGELLDRQEICLSNGCTSFWVVDPKTRSVQVTVPDRQPALYDSSSSLPLPAPLAGAIPVASIFQDPA